MFEDIIPFSISIEPETVASVALWTLALCLGFTPTREWVVFQIERWFNFAERSLYTTETEYERTRVARESQNAFYASIFSVIPFTGGGILCNYAIERTLGFGWTTSIGLIACFGAGIYELGRQQGNNEESWELGVLGFALLYPTYSSLLWADSRLSFLKEAPPTIDSRNWWL